MAGLLDFQMPGMDTPEGQGLLAAAFNLMSAQKYPGQKGALAGALGDAGRSYMQTTNQSRDQAQRRKYLDAQMEAQQMQLEAARRAEQQRAAQEAAIRNHFAPQGPAQAMANGRGPTMENAQRLGQMPQFDPRRLLSEGGVGALEQGLKINDALNPKPQGPIKLGENDRLLDPATFRELVSPAKKPASLPSPVQEYQFAVQNDGYKGTYTDWLRENKRAGASSINVGGAQILPKKFSDELDKMAAQSLMGDYSGARNASTAIAAAKDVIGLLDKGAFTGKLGPAKEALSGWYQATTGRAIPELDATQQLKTVIGDIVLPALSNLKGASSDRDFIKIEEYSRGEATMTETALRGHMQRLMNKYGNQIESYNTQFDNYAKQRPEVQIPGIGRIEMPQGNIPSDDAPPKGAQAMPTLPPAQQHKGRTVRDTATGKKLKSNGMTWVEVK